MFHEKASSKKHHLGLFRTRSFQKSRKQKTSERNQRQQIRRKLKGSCFLDLCQFVNSVNLIFSGVADARGRVG